MRRKPKGSKTVFAKIGGTFPTSNPYFTRGKTFKIEQ
jgi:hypothetical protein